MVVQNITRYIRPIEDVREDLVGRARGPTHPWPPYADGEIAERIFANIHSLDRDEWAEAFSAEARPFGGSPPWARLVAGLNRSGR